MIQPAVKLLRFWKLLLASNLATMNHEDKSGMEAAGLPVMATPRAEQLSATLRNATTIGKHEAELWLKYWQKIGFLPA